MWVAPRAPLRPSSQLDEGFLLSGKLHLGHYVGSLRNRVTAQDNHECFFLLADLHTLTTHPGKSNITKIAQNITEIVADYLAVGIDPEKSTIFVQSAIPEIYELNMLLGMLATVPRLQRIPSLKEMAASSNLKSLSYGSLGYPVFMAGDILLPRANLVPVGSDNISNVELARELSRHFNRMYGQVFPIPKAIEEKTLIGTNSSVKMSKSLNNTIFLSDEAEIVEEKIMRMRTDPKRISSTTPGCVEGNPVFAYHDEFNPDIESVEELKNCYRKGKVGDVEVKRKLINIINDLLDPIRGKRIKILNKPNLIPDILAHGNCIMKREATETIQIVRESMGLSYKVLSEVKEAITS